MTQDPVALAGPTEAVPGSGGEDQEPGASLWLDAWRDLRRRPLFWVSAVGPQVLVAKEPEPRKVV